MNVVVSDLDGTLLRSNRTVSERTLRVLEALRNRGIILTIATARPPRSVFTLLPSIPDDMYVICYNGAELYLGTSLIYHRYMGPRVSQQIINGLLANEDNARVSVEMNGRLYTNFDITLMEGWIPPYERVHFSSFEYGDAAKILVDLRSVDDLTGFRGAIPESCKLVNTDGGTLAQIAHREVSKLNGVRRLANILGCTPADFVALGDDYNDLDIIRECGTGIAMANAPAEVREAADIVAASNDEDGAAIVLERLFSIESV